MLNIDLSNYQNNLSTAKNQAKADNASNLAIFHQLLQTAIEMGEK